VASLAAALPVGRIARRTWLAAAYAVPAVLVWALLGLLLNLAPLSLTALALIVAYGLYYGLVEATSRPGLPAPGRTWQVPAGWVDRTPPWRRSLVWGSLLGPGLATRNPYAGFGLLLLAVASVGNLRAGVVFAAAIGLLHATGRVLGLVRDLRTAVSADYLQSVMRSLRWRRLDGFALLFFAGLAAMTIALR
jgi:hypothetical protein